MSRRFWFTSRWVDFDRDRLVGGALTRSASRVRNAPREACNAPSGMKRETKKGNATSVQLTKTYKLTKGGIKN